MTADEMFEKAGYIKTEFENDKEKCLIYKKTTDTVFPIVNEITLLLKAKVAYSREYVSGLFNENDGDTKLDAITIKLLNKKITELGW